MSAGPSVSFSCPICNRSIAESFLSRHISVVHLNFHQFKCGSDGCDDKFIDREEVDKHQMTFGHFDQPVEMGLEMSYLKAVGDLISFHSIQISKVTDSGAKQRRLAHILTQMEKCQTDPRVIRTTTSRDSAQSLVISNEGTTETASQELSGNPDQRTRNDFGGEGRDNVESRMSLGEPRRKRSHAEMLRATNSRTSYPTNFTPSTLSSDQLVTRQLVSTLILPDEKPLAMQMPTSKRVVLGFKTTKKSIAGVMRSSRSRSRVSEFRSCGICGDSVPSDVFPSLFEHCWNHVDFSAFTCSLCGFDDLSRKEVENHLKGVHKDEIDAKVLLPSAFQISEFCSQWRAAFHIKADLELLDVPADHPMLEVVERMKSFRKSGHFCAVCSTDVTPPPDSKYVSHTTLCRHAYQHARWGRYICGVCGKIIEGTNAILEHCQKEHSGEGKPSAESMLEREEMFNRCFNQWEKHEVKTEVKKENKEEKVDRRPKLPAVRVRIRGKQSQRRIRGNKAVAKATDWMHKCTSIFKWKPLKYRLWSKCSICPQPKQLNRSDLNVLAYHAWSHASSMPFSCSECDFGALRHRQVESHIQLVHKCNGTVKLPTTFLWSEFDSFFHQCFHLYIPPPAEWPTNFFLHPFIPQLTLVISQSEECSVCRIRPNVDEGAVTVSHRLKVNHVYSRHVGPPYSCSHECGRAALTWDRIGRHLKEAHGGIGYVVGPSEENKAQMREHFEICFGPSYKAQLDAREEVVMHPCLQCQQNMTVTLTEDPRFDHVWRQHMAPKVPYRCSECTYNTYVHGGVRLHIAKSHDNVGKYLLPSDEVIQEFIEMYRSCFTSDPPVKFMNTLKKPGCPTDSFTVFNQMNPTHSTSQNLSLVGPSWPQDSTESSSKKRSAEIDMDRLMFAESVTDSSETEVLVKMEFLSDNEYGNSGRVEVLPPPARTLSDTENAQNASVTQYMAGILHPGGRNKLFPSCIQPSIRTNMEKPERLNPIRADEAISSRLHTVDNSGVSNDGHVHREFQNSPAEAELPVVRCESVEGNSGDPVDKNWNSVKTNEQVKGEAPMAE